MFQGVDESDAHLVQDGRRPAGCQCCPAEPRCRCSRRTCGSYRLSVASSIPGFLRSLDRPQSIFAAQAIGRCDDALPVENFQQLADRFLGVAGALGGILIPMVLDRVRADPAVASGTFVTTITDVVGFFSFLGIATLWFGLK